MRRSAYSHVIQERMAFIMLSFIPVGKPVAFMSDNNMQSDVFELRTKNISYTAYSFKPPHPFGHLAILNY